MPDCLFCKIINKEVSGKIIYEDEDTIAVLDVFPRAPGHAMVIPKVHAENILELPDDKVGPVFETVKKMTAKIKKALNPDGFTIGINHGKVSVQAINHLHVHILPRWENDGGGSVHSVVNNPPKESLDEILKKIKQIS